MVAYLSRLRGRVEAAVARILQPALPVLVVPVVTPDTEFDQYRGYGAILGFARRRSRILGLGKFLGASDAEMNSYGACQWQTCGRYSRVGPGLMLCRPFDAALLGVVNCAGASCEFRFRVSCDRLAVPRRRFLLFRCTWTSLNGPRTELRCAKRLLSKPVASGQSSSHRSSDLENGDQTMAVGRRKPQLEVRDYRGCVGRAGGCCSAGSWRGVGSGRLRGILVHRL